MEDKQQTPENTNRFQSSREDSSSPTRCAPRVPHSGLFPLHGAAHKQESCKQDSPPERRAFLYGKKSKRIAAWICILSLASLYIATFLTAILDTPGSGNLFRTCLGATIVLPTLLWMYLWLYGRIKDREKDS